MAVSSFWLSTAVPAWDRQNGTFEGLNFLERCTGVAKGNGQLEASQSCPSSQYTTLYQAYHISPPEFNFLLRGKDIGNLFPIKQEKFPLVVGQALRWGYLREATYWSLLLDILHVGGL